MDANYTRFELTSDLIALNNIVLRLGHFLQKTIKIPVGVNGDLLKQFTL